MKGHNFKRQKNFLFFYLIGIFGLYLALLTRTVSSGYSTQFIESLNACLTILPNDGNLALPGIFNWQNLLWLVGIGLLLKLIIASLQAGLTIYSSRVLLKSSYIPRPYELFTVGLWRPRVIMGNGVSKVLTSVELQAATKHEEYHSQERDPLRQLLVDFILSATPYFPGKRQVAEQYRSLTELGADQHAVEHSARPGVLVSALFKLTSSGLPLVSELVGAVSRLDILTDRRQPNLVKLAALITISGATLVIPTVVMASGIESERPVTAAMCRAQLPRSPQSAMSSEN